MIYRNIIGAFYIYMARKLNLLNNLIQFFALLLCMRTILGDMTDRNDDHRLEVSPLALLEILVHLLRVVIANPASTQTSFSSTQAKVLSGNGNIDVAVRFVVLLAHPVLLLVAHSHDIHRSGLKPLSIIALLELSLRLIRLHHQPLPWLLVASRRSHAHALQHILQIILAHGFSRKLTSGESLLAQCQHIFHNLYLLNQMPLRVCCKDTTFICFSNKKMKKLSPLLIFYLPMTNDKAIDFTICDLK